MSARHGPRAGTLALFGSLILLGAVSSAPVLRRIDKNDLQTGDGAIVVFVRAAAALADETDDRFSARFVAHGAKAGDWVPCTTAPAPFCRYASGASGARSLRFAALDSAGGLQIRYAVGAGTASAPVFIDVAPAPATDTLKAISRGFDATPAPDATPSVTLELDLEPPAEAPAH
jgi:hypothetical protein